MRKKWIHRPRISTLLFALLAVMASCTLCPCISSTCLALANEQISSLSDNPPAVDSQQEVQNTSSLLSNNPPAVDSQQETQNTSLLLSDNPPAVDSQQEAQNTSSLLSNNPPAVDSQQEAQDATSALERSAEDDASAIYPQASYTVTTWNQLVEYAAGGVASGSTLVLGANLLATSICYIDQSLSIDGQGLYKVTRSASWTISDLFFVRSGTTTIHELVIDGASVSCEGTAICVANGGLILTDSTIKNCSSSLVEDRRGGAIFVPSDTSGCWMRARDCSFLNNTAKGWGGAVCVSATSSAEFYSCSFANNCAVAGNLGIGRGGAVYAEGSIYAESSIFSSNNAVWGGAICSFPNDLSKKCTISSCTFSNDFASLGGETIAIGKAKNSISGCTINSAAQDTQSRAEIHAGQAGGMLTISNCLIMRPGIWLNNYGQAVSLSGYLFVNPAARIYDPRSTANPSSISIAAGFTVRASAGSSAGGGALVYSTSSYANGHVVAQYSSTPNAEQFTSYNSSYYTTASGSKVVLTKKPPSLSGRVTISGTLEYPQAITAQVTGLPAGVIPAFQWYRGENVIAAETGSTYAIVQEDVGEVLSVKVSDANGVYSGIIQANTSRVPEPVVSFSVTSTIPAAIAGDGTITGISGSIVNTSRFPIYLTSIQIDFHEQEALFDDYAALTAGVQINGGNTRVMTGSPLCYVPASAQVCMQPNEVLTLDYSIALNTAVYQYKSGSPKLADIVYFLDWRRS